MQTYIIGDSPLFQALGFISDLIKGFIDFLDEIILIDLGTDAFGGAVPLVSLWDLMMGFVIVGFVITVFWKGARA